MHLGPGGETWIDAGGAEEIKSDEGLRKQLVPEMEWEVGISCAEACYEVIFEGADGTFGGIASVYAGRNKLEVDGFTGHVGLENAGGFVVEFLKFGFKASGFE